MIPYIGDISKQDAELIKRLVEIKGVKNVLEFGCGASTQVIAAYFNGKFTTVDTEQFWIDKTKENLKLLEIKNEPIFVKYDEFGFPDNNYDFVFVDGLQSLREKFGAEASTHLSEWGMLAFHDTRHTDNINLVLDIARMNNQNVRAIYFNYADSNISIICRGTTKRRYDWNVEESRLKWQNGNGDPDIEYIKAELKKNG